MSATWLSGTEKALEMNTKGSILYSTGLLYEEELFRGVKPVTAAETLHYGQDGV
ncbi:hypothetical protein FOXG_21486 [Fusarium oxysporum f. sp. lycopersici 4287]|jgi:hypothetical protein|uniref:Uncharacterized protein n=1 Tax=Fusarium oxysporum f. sp. lycopersici (strain 4287 / CBS 123668 / FGSC 9935 / NRRL 34936) TaxID=426428 RepID=A0A0J9WTC5_FUSO4|nr:hypothetical protein FOXG_21486 [Fusarium oxysporum f. sp. lycopersici 4287]EWZ77317.1 hypothetical protein FOWG_18263 [Fusarium oxysporum f. sp. lycopersici MN25]KAI8416543.1 hypothetical protein FOFC_02854 [Fusarium oxysporum]KNB15792.1 hypothetical protein FOXG_21486 [Fusarium oxysporum f. sp. lycopersici 4287]